MWLNKEYTYLPTIERLLA